VINILAGTTILQSTKIYDENPKIWWIYCNGGPWMQLNKWEYVEYTCTVQPRGKTQNPRYHQGQNQQFADRRGDSTRTMIVDKFYHFHHHHGITLNADPSWCRAQWTITFLYNVLYKPMCTKYLDCIKFTLKNQCKCGHFNCMWTW
jgi:hypothetical protein